MSSKRQLAIILGIVLFFPVVIGITLGAVYPGETSTEFAILAVIGTPSSVVGLGVLVWAVFWLKPPPTVLKPESEEAPRVGSKSGGT